MRKARAEAGRQCPICGKKENQVNAGKNRSGSQRCFCKECKKYYTLNPKTREYPEEVRQQEIKTFYAGASGRGVGKVFGFSKANVYNWRLCQVKCVINFLGIGLQRIYRLEGGA